MTENNSKNLFTLKKSDFYLTGILVCFSLGSLFPIRQMTNNRGEKAILYQAGKKIKTFSLKENQIYDFNQIKIEVQNQSIGIIESNCPRKICMHTGTITSSAKTIVCVPNQVLIEIIADKHQELNAVSY